MSDIILTGDNVNEGRIKINSALDALDILWSGDVGDNSIRRVLNGNNYGNRAFSANSISWGAFSLSEGENSHSEGYSTASGSCAYSSGYLSFAANDYSFSSGVGGIGVSPFYVFASGKYSFAHSYGYGYAGLSNGALADNSVILGGENNNVHENSKSSGIFGGWRSFIENTIDSHNSNIISSSYKGNMSNYKHSSIVSSYESTITSASEEVSSSIIGGGKHEINESSGSIILGGGGRAYYEAGNLLSASTTSSILSSKFSTISKSSESVILGGSGNTIGQEEGSTPAAAILNENCIIVGGNQNKITNASLYGASEESFIVGGSGNTVTAYRSGIIGGKDNQLLNTYQANGSNRYCALIGGTENKIDNQFVGGLSQTKVDNSVIIGGSLNFIQAAFAGFIIKNSVFMGIGTKSNGGGISGTTWTMGGSPTPPTFPSVTNNTIAFNDGQGYWDGGISSPAGDYAEYFEWNDGNIENEDRVGYFTSLVDEKIEIGNSNVLGIVSAKPSIVGDSASLSWQNMYQKNDWGETLYEPYKVYQIKKINDEEEQNIYIDKNNNIYSDAPNITNMSGTLYNGDTNDKIFIENINVRIVNPNYDKNEEYIPREERKEWSPIGMLGKLHVRTSEQITGSTISANSNGMAINGNDYHVLENKKSYDGNYGVVKILFK
jgi:hypothetical protein